MARCCHRALVHKCLRLNQSHSLVVGLGIAWKGLRVDTLVVLESRIEVGMVLLEKRITKS